MVMNDNNQIDQPKRFYKYYPIESWQYMCRDWTIRFTPPDDFNDPFEFLPAITGLACDDNLYELFESNFSMQVTKGAEEVWKGLDSNLREIFSMKVLELPFNLNKNILYKNFLDLVQMATPRFASLLPQKIKSLVGVLCLTTQNDNLLMWSHYGNSYKGFVVEYDAKNEFFHRGEDINFTLRPVMYASTRPNKNINELDINDFLYIKSNIWAYENEYRLVTPLTDNERYLWYDNKKRGVCDIPKQAVKSIIFGAKLSQDTIR